MFITDAQLHTWELSRRDRPWPEGMIVPGWALRPVPASELLREMNQAGVARAVLVPPSFEGDRNDLCLAAAAAHPDRFGVMGRLRLDDPARGIHLRGWLDNPGALGLRFTFFMDRHRQWLFDGTAEWLWPAAATLGVPLMVLPRPNDVPLFRDIALRYPDLRLIIDHMAVGHEPWRRDNLAFEHLDHLLALNDAPNVAVKASGLPEHSTHPYPYRNMHGYVQEVVSALGAERVMWGTDLTRMPCTYAQAIRMFTEEMDFLTTEDLQWIMHGTIAHWLNWPHPLEST